MVALCKVAGAQEIRRTARLVEMREMPSYGRSPFLCLIDMDSPQPTGGSGELRSDGHPPTLATLRRPPGVSMDVEESHYPIELPRADMDLDKACAGSHQSLIDPEAGSHHEVKRKTGSVCRPSDHDAFVPYSSATIYSHWV